MENIERKTEYTENSAVSELAEMPEFSEEVKKSAERNIAEAKSRLSSTEEQILSNEQEEEPDNMLLGVYEIAKGDNAISGDAELSDKNIVGFLFSDYDALWNLEQSGYTFSPAEKAHIANIVLDEYSDNSMVLREFFGSFFESSDDLKNFIKERDDFFTSYIQQEDVAPPSELSSNDAFVELIFRENHPELIANVESYSSDGLKMLASQISNGVELPGNFGNQQQLATTLFENKGEFDSSEFCELLTLLRNKEQYDRKTRNGQNSFELLVGENVDYLINVATEADALPKCLIESEIFRDSCIDNGRFDLATKCILPPNFFEDDKITEAYCSELGIGVEDFIARKNWLLDYQQKNNDVFGSILGTSLKDDIFNLNKEHYEKFINDIGIQADIAKLGDSELTVFSEILNNYDYRDFDVAPMVTALVKNMKDYGQLLDSLDPEQLSDNDLRQLVGVLQLPKNQYEVNSLDDLKNYRALKEKYFIDNFDNNDLNQNKDNLIRMLFNIDLKEARYIDFKYCHDDDNKNTLERLENSELPKEDFIRLALINKITECDDNSELADLYNQLKDRDIYDSEIPLDSYLRSEYSKLYSDSLYRMDENEQVYGPKDSVFEQVDYKGKSVKIGIPREKFAFFIHCVGSCSLGSEVSDENYAKDWLDRPHMQDHFVACSYIDERRINDIRSGGSIIYGFDSLEGGAILGMGDTDIDSIGPYSRAYNGSRDLQEGNGARARFFVPSEILASKRESYNEIVIERRNNSEDKGEQIKRKPNYIIMMAESGNPDNFNQLDTLYDNQLSFITDDDKETIAQLGSGKELKAFLKKYIDTIRQEANDQGVPLNDLANSYVSQILKAKYFEDCLKAASEFDIPLVIIDKTYYFNKILQESGAYNTEEATSISETYAESDDYKKKQLFRAVAKGQSIAGV